MVNRVILKEMTEKLKVGKLKGEEILYYVDKLRSIFPESSVDSNINPLTFPVIPNNLYATLSESIRENFKPLDNRRRGDNLKFYDTPEGILNLSDWKIMFRFTVQRAEKYLL